MKNVVAVFAAILFMLPNVAVANHMESEIVINVQSQPSSDRNSFMGAFTAAMLESQGISRWAMLNGTRRIELSADGSTTIKVPNGEYTLQFFWQGRPSDYQAAAHRAGSNLANQTLGKAIPNRQHRERMANNANERSTRPVNKQSQVLSLNLDSRRAVVSVSMPTITTQTIFAIVTGNNELANIESDESLRIGGGSQLTQPAQSTQRQTQIAPTPPPASLPLEQRPVIAVYVSGHGDPTVNNFLAADLTRALARTERYREAPRYEEFLAATVEQQGQTISEIHLAELARNYEIQQVGIASMTSILGSYAITLKIVNVETGETIANAELDNSLATLADIRVASAELVGAMFGTATQSGSPQVISLQSGQHVVQGADGQIVIINTAPINTAPQYQPRERSPFWKNHWTYMGGSLGFGRWHDVSEYWESQCYYNVTWDGCYRYRDDNGTSFAAAYVVDFPLLSWFGVETGAIIGNRVYGAYSMGRVGFISENFEATNDWGIVLGSTSLMIGGTMGFKAGSGMLFLRY